MALKEAPLRPLEEQLRLLTLHIRANLQGLLIVAVPDAEAERALADETRRWLGGEASIAEVRLEPEPVERLSLSHHLSTLPRPSGPAAVFVFGLDELPAEARTTAINAMNWGRERLRHAGYTVVLFVRPPTPGELGNRAPDFFSWRSDVFQFAFPDDGAEREHALARLRLFAGADLGELTRRYREYVIDACRWLDFRGLLQVRNIVRMPLDDVFVFPELITTVDGGALAWSSASGEPARIDSELHLLRLVERRLQLGAAVRQAERLVILGDPGSGKSTALRFLALTYAQGRDRVRERLGIDEERLPILIPLAAFAEARAGHDQPTLEAFLPAYFKAQGLPDLTLLFTSALATGRAALLLDGLDEMLDVRDRADVAGAIADFMAAHGDVLIVVSSRIAGFKGGALPSPFSVFTIAPLDDEGIKRFATHWTRAFEAAGLERPGALSEDAARRAERRAESLVAAATGHPGVRQLASNALMLTLLALVHHQGTRLPNRRADLYRLCVEALAETWNLARSLSGRSINVSLGDRRLDEDFVVRALAPVAYWMHETQPSGVISAAELVAKIADQFVIQDDIDRREAEKLASDFLDLAREQMGLLVERAPQSFGFVHLAIQEYLAARFLSERHDPFARIRPRLHDPRWAEVVRLTAGTLRGDHAAAFVENVVSAHVPREGIDRRLPMVRRPLTKTRDAGAVRSYGRYRRELVRTLLSLLDVRVGADCVAEGVAILPTQRRWITGFVMDRWLENTPSRLYWRPAVVKLGRDVSAREVGHELQRVLIDESLDLDLRADAATVLSEIIRQPEDARRLLDVLTATGQPDLLRRAVAQGLSGAARTYNEIGVAVRDIFCDTTRDAELRIHAADVLGRTGLLTDDDIHVLLGIFEDRRLSPTIREAAARALGPITRKQEGAANVLRSAIRDRREDPGVRAASVIAAIRTPDIASELVVVLEDSREDVSVRRTALLALRFTAPPARFGSILFSIMRDEREDPVLRADAAEILAHVASGDVGVRRALVSLAADKRAPALARYGFVDGLGSIVVREPSAKNLLVNLTRDDDVLARSAALFACGRLWREGSVFIRALFDALDDPLLYGGAVLWLGDILAEGGLREIERVIGSVERRESEQRKGSRRENKQR